MNKKGAEVLETLVKFIPAFLIAVVALYVLFTLWGAFFQEEATGAMRDFDRVYKNLVDLLPGESMNVFTKGANYTIKFISKEDLDPEPSCAGKPCICVYEIVKGGVVPTKCEVFENIDCEKAVKEPDKYSCIESKEIQVSVSPSQVRISKSGTGVFSLI